VNVLSSAVRFLTGEPVSSPACKYYPSCSHYAADAVRKHGPIRGSLKAAWRILRCNPWSSGGVDYA
jgi:hypothetical protein